MEHEYLFRGKTTNTHEWVYGGIYIQNNRYFIVKTIRYSSDTRDERIAEYYENNPSYTYGMYEVDPKTVGRFTGLVVKDKKKVFEGDVIMFGGEPLVVYWNGETLSWQAKKIHAPYPYRRFPHENWDYIDLGWIAAELVITGEMTTRLNNSDESMCTPETICEDEDISWEDEF